MAEPVTLAVLLKKDACLRMKVSSGQAILLYNNMDNHVFTDNYHRTEGMGEKWETTGPLRVGGPETPAEQGGARM